jgi:hypothetical protein
MKDESYTIRAQLGSVDNPFSMTGIAGNATKATAAQTGEVALSPTVNPTTGSSNVSTATINGDSTVSTPLSTSTIVSANPPGNGKASSRGLSTGGKAGIGVGIAMGILIAIVLAVWLAKRKQKLPSKEATETESGTAELHSNDVKIYETEVEAYSKHELAADTRPELDGNHRSELDGRATIEILGINALHEVDGQPRDGTSGRSTERWD